jgi:long-chain acyl-CoA synthetase
MGDLGRFDSDGWLFLTGRSAELILSGGVNVYPAEIDAALLMHPAVGDVATIGVPNEEWGEEVKAVVQLAEGLTASDELTTELLAHCRDHLAGYKCPRSIDYSDDLPRLPTGKIQRGRVRERYL